MPIHDWTRVRAGIFHHFHHGWISSLSNALNRGPLPPGYYAMIQQITGGLGPDVLTLEAPTQSALTHGTPDQLGGVAVAAAPPKVRHHARSESDQYARKAKAVVVRHSSDHRVVAMVEIVSPGNKTGRGALRQFVETAQEFLNRGVHLLIVDLFPPGSFDPQGIHKLIWEYDQDSFELTSDTPLTLAAYIGGEAPEAYVEPTAIGLPLIDMPLFLTPDFYVPIPLEQTSQTAWEAVPAVWRNVLESRPEA